MTGLSLRHIAGIAFALALITQGAWADDFKFSARDATINGQIELELNSEDTFELCIIGEEPVPTSRSVNHYLMIVARHEELKGGSVYKHHIGDLAQLYFLDIGSAGPTRNRYKNMRKEYEGKPFQKYCEEVKAPRRGGAYNFSYRIKWITRNFEPGMPPSPNADRAKRFFEKHSWMFRLYTDHIKPLPGTTLVVQQTMALDTPETDNNNTDWVRIGRSIMRSIIRAIIKGVF